MNETINNIKTLTDSLNNQLANLDVMLKSLNIKAAEQKEFERKRDLIEQKLAERESKVMSDLHHNEETKKQNELNRQELEAKQTKLQSEWSRMLEDKQRLEQDKEEIAREKLRLANRETELKERERTIATKTEETDTLSDMLKKKQEALDDLDKKMKSRQQLTEQKAREIDAMHASLD